MILTGSLQFKDALTLRTGTAHHHYFVVAVTFVSIPEQYIISTRRFAQHPRRISVVIEVPFWLTHLRETNYFKEFCLVDIIMSV